ncbi:LysR family transcriptional regulator [Phyllobacterium brassicacearum]|uniref:LysR family transcriptional regulator n=1 Tax=Phyllobacterium brassicacearum TaxID=314235 RepID=A0A2P7BMK6_9HYPH|nr:LysR family transcriptional regulator [Phyllobacterium brassicacearum]PSH67698.1 LysR family transcriptional regulator [Phyllobacterium brassicacearum]TDQ25938.1 LysR family transcriptional regulator [Phyllobacterium brassicacearum]
MDNRAGEMDVFVQAVELNSFSSAGRRLGLSPSAVSKMITRIEDRLGTRLLVRSTRTLRLTPEGEIYHQRALRIVAEIEEAERAVAFGASAAPRGLLRVNSSVPVGVHCILPLVPKFLQCYPEVELDVSLSDGVVDLIEERADIAIRVGPMRDSSLKARKLFESRMVVVASPDYLAKHGMPEHPHDLDKHNCLNFNFRRIREEWPFKDPESGETEMLTVSGNFLANNGVTVQQMCVAGLGIARLGLFHVRADIIEGRLVPVLEAYNPGDMEMTHAVFVGHEYLAARVRSFVDFLSDNIGSCAELPVPLTNGAAGS